MKTLASDPVLLRWICGILIAAVPGMWALLKWHYQERYEARLKGLQERIDGKNEKIAELEKALSQTQPAALLKDREQWKAWIEHQVTTQFVRQIEDKDQEISRLEREHRTARAEAEQLGKNREQLASHLLQFDSRLAIAEAEKKDLQHSLREAHRFADGITAAALKSAAQAREEYEDTKASVWHIFTKKGDARQEFAKIQEQANAQGLVQGSAAIKALEFHESPEGGSTIARVIGHEWYTLLRAQAGWGYLTKGPNDYVTDALVKWAGAYANHLQNSRSGHPRSMQMTVWWDCIGISFQDSKGTAHHLNLLATMVAGRLTPMAGYFSGGNREVEREARAWSRKHETSVHAPP